MILAILVARLKLCIMTVKTVPSTNKAAIQSIFQAQRANQYAVAQTTAKERIQKLKRLQAAIEVTYRQAIRDALYQDFRKHPAEVDLTEVFIILKEIKYACSHLRRWMGKHRVATPLTLAGSSSWIRYEPKGVCLIVSPWNFPVNLTFCPLISAIAAGNTAILKPSEHTPHTSAVMRQIVEDVFDQNEVALVEGGIETSTELLSLPFNHIFFTGAPAIGKIVMKAAAEHLTSVTLELGGKSPTIVDETANLNIAAKRIAWGKFLNNGQICIAPDYVFVHESRKDAFIEAVDIYLKKFYGSNAAEQDSYNRIVSPRHFERLQAYLNDSVEQGAKVALGGETRSTDRYFEPTLVTDVPQDAPLMTKEIFGPILPVMTYQHLDEVIDYIRAGEKPLALYIYSKSNKNIRTVIENTRAGGTCINNNDIHFFNSNLPFGGSNNSGIGKSHGWFGFEGFSNARGIYRQHLPSAIDLLMPPFNKLKMKIVELTVKWF